MKLAVISLRYSSWSIRPWLALTHAGAEFETATAEIQPQPQTSVGGMIGTKIQDLPQRKALGSVTGLFPVLHVDGVAIHEALAICEFVAERFPQAQLWPADTLQRAVARSLSTEMAAGFPQLREHLSCHPFARVPGFVPNASTRKEIDRVFEIWEQCLASSGGPFLFGGFTIVDCMYFPVVTRFATYGVTLPPGLEAYAAAMWALPAVQAWKAIALTAPRLEAYDQGIVALGGDPG